MFRAGYALKGWMEKKGGSVDSFEKRFCVLSSHGHLYYFAREDDMRTEGSEKGILDLSTVARMVVTRGSAERDIGALRPWLIYKNGLPIER